MPPREVTGLEYRWDDAPFVRVDSLRAVTRAAGVRRLEVRVSAPELAECSDPALMVEWATQLDGATIGGRSVEVRRTPYGVVPLARDDAGRSVVLSFDAKHAVREGSLLAGCERGSLHAEMRGPDG